MHPVHPRPADIRDQHSRAFRDLRISVTDRCNFRCSYCMPKDVFDAHYQYIPHASLLSFEEISQIAQAFLRMGLRKVRLTGGEPLLRKGIENLVLQLSRLRTSDNRPLDLALTTNGSLLARKAQPLHDTGLRRVTVSLDALDEHIFQSINSVGFKVADVLHGIDTALKAGLTPLKVNVVVKRGLNESQIIPLARHFKGTGVVVRFIEYMDVGSTNGWRMEDVVRSAQTLETLQSAFSLRPLDANAVGETAQRWQHADGSGEIGLISSVSNAFCSDCNRARLSTEGRLYLCLFAASGHDLRTFVRDQRLDIDQLTERLAHIWQQRGDRYSELRATPTASQQSVMHIRPIEMSYIGG